MSRSLAFPPREEGLRLHVRLCDQEADATADLCAAYLEPLLAWAEKPFPRVDLHLRTTAVHEALVGYLRRPHRYDPRKSDLAAYLRMAVRGDLKNLLRKEAGRRDHEITWNSVEEGGEPGNYLGKEDDPARMAERAEDAAEAERFFQAVTDGWDDTERQVLLLMLDGERGTADFAAALGIAGAGSAEQAGEVKRLKDRVKGRLKRWRQRHGH